MGKLTRGRGGVKKGIRWGVGRRMIVGKEMQGWG